MRDEKEVKYADEVSGGDRMVVMVTLGGGNNCNLVVSTMISINLSRFNPIRNLNDDVPGVTYRTSAKAFMDKGLFIIS